MVSWPWPSVSEDVGAATGELADAGAVCEVAPAGTCELGGVCGGPYHLVHFVVSAPRLGGVHEAVATVRQLVVVGGNEVPRDGGSDVAIHIVAAEEAAPACAGFEVGRKVFTGPLRYGQCSTAVRSNRVRVVTSYTCHSTRPLAISQQVVTHTPWRTAVVGRHYQRTEVVSSQRRIQTQYVRTRVRVLIPYSNVVDSESMYVACCHQPFRDVRDGAVGERTVATFSYPAGKPPTQSVQLRHSTAHTNRGRIAALSVHPSISAGVFSAQCGARVRRGSVD